MAQQIRKGTSCCCMVPAKDPLQPEHGGRYDAGKLARVLQERPEVCRPGFESYRSWGLSTFLGLLLLLLLLWARAWLCVYRPLRQSAPHSLVPPRHRAGFMKDDLRRYQRRVVGILGGMERMRGVHYCTLI